MTVIKRSRANSCTDLVEAIDNLIPLLRDQKENDGADQLFDAMVVLKKAKPDSTEQKDAVAKVIDAFEGDAELIAYTFQRDTAPGEWTVAEVLSQASSRVLSLARRMQ